MADYYLKTGIETNIIAVESGKNRGAALGNSLGDNTGYENTIKISENTKTYLDLLGKDTFIIASKDDGNDHLETREGIDLTPLLNITASNPVNAAVLNDMMKQGNVPPALLTQIASDITVDDTSIILNAVKKENPANLAAIQKGLKVNGGLNTPQDGYTPLHMAIKKSVVILNVLNVTTLSDEQREVISTQYKNNAKIIKTLAADKKIDFKKADKNGNNIIQAAVASGNPEIIKTLLENTAKAMDVINLQDSNNKTPLHVAIKNAADAAKNAKDVPTRAKATAALEVVKALAADKNIDFKKADVHGNNIIQAAVASGNPEIIKTLLENTAKAKDVINLQDTNNDNKTPLHVAIENAKDPNNPNPAAALEAVKALAADPNIDFKIEDKARNNIIQAAVVSGNPEIIKTLLENTAKAMDVINLQDTN
ncbi:MAG: ankyrin repeat domain-containing protein, partial [Legionellales bacterium]|nr:ankyrin repeat domain-containing protein [Legionellales bacterium]